MNSPDHIRNVAVLGNLQHGMIDDQQRRWVGKTSFVDMLIESTHAKKWPLDSDVFTRLKCHPPRFITPILWKLSRTVTSAFRALLFPSCWKTVALIPTYWIWSIAPVTPTFLVKSQQVFFLSLSEDMLSFASGGWCPPLCGCHWRRHDADRALPPSCSGPSSPSYCGLY